MWETDIREIINVFRNSLLAIIPYMDQAKISWREPQEYDDWDEIAELLFKKLVVNSILWSFPEEDMEKPELPQYDMVYSSYSKMSFIEVLPDSQIVIPGLAFHSFSTQENPFDMIRSRYIDQNGNIVKEEFNFTPYKRAYFQLKYRDPIQGLRVIKNLTVNL